MCWAFTREKIKQLQCYHACRATLRSLSKTAIIASPFFMFIFHSFYLHFEAEKYEPTGDVPEWRKPNISVSPLRYSVHWRPEQLSPVVTKRNETKIWMVRIDPRDLSSSQKCERLTFSNCFTFLTLIQIIKLYNAILLILRKAEISTKKARQWRSGLK